jgi:hypothetical protein
MFQRLAESISVSFAIAAVMIYAVAVRPVAAQQAQPYRAPRLVGTQNPNLNGIWQAVNTANWELESHSPGASPFPALLGLYGAEPPGRGVVDGGKIPYQPWAEAKKKENFEKRLTRPTDLKTNETTGDPEAKCYLPGVPRATYMPYPFQIVQTPKQILFAYEFAAARRSIVMDHKPKALSDTWMGWSTGQWDGDTLVVDVTNQNDKTWFDRAGDFHSDALHVVERYTPIDAGHLMYQATMEDPKVFTRPWTIKMPLYRRIEENAQVLEYRCVEFSEEFMYGRFIDSSSK